MNRVLSVVRQEKVHQSLFNGVEHFDKTSMKHAETVEKNPLPDPAGKQGSNHFQSGDDFKPTNRCNRRSSNPQLCNTKFLRIFMKSTDIVTLSVKKKKL